MKRYSLLLVTMAICTILSATVSAQKKTSTSCGSDVKNLSLSVESSSLGITADIDAPYATKKTRGDQIEAMFQINNCSQDFTLNLNFSPRFMYVDFPEGGGSYHAKFFNFDRVASVPITPTNLTDSQKFLDTHFCKNGWKQIDGFIVEKNPDGTYRDNYAGCAIDASGKAYVRRIVGIGLDDPYSSADYRLRFQASPIDGGSQGPLVTGTSYIKVYHPDASTWYLLPEFETNPTTGISDSIGAKLEYIDQFYLRGTYSMPFRFRLTTF